MNDDVSSEWLEYCQLNTCPVIEGFYWWHLTINKSKSLKHLLLVSVIHCCQTTSSELLLVKSHLVYSFCSAAYPRPDCPSEYRSAGDAAAAAGPTSPLYHGWNHWTSGGVGSVLDDDAESEGFRLHTHTLLMFSLHSAWTKSSTPSMSARTTIGNPP